MAWIRNRRRKDGGTTYTVTWREPGDDKESTLTFKDDLPRAEETVRLLDANGQSFAAAAKVLEDAKLTGPTLYEAMGAHIAQLVGVGDYQIGRYKSARERYFKHGLGARKIAGIEHRDVVEWVKGMEDLGLSAKTIANHHGLLSATFTTAVRDRAIDHNPSKGVRLPKAQHAGDEEMPTREDWLLIRPHLDPFYTPFFDFLVGTGCRFGEATALTPADFQLDATTPTVRVNKAWKRASDNSYYLGPPKTSKGKRTVSLAPSTVAAVRPLLDAAGDGLVFRLKRGSMMRSPDIHGRVWQPAIRAARKNGLTKHVTIHQLRHLHAAMMLAAGLPIYELSRRLGHESVQMSIDKYSHLLPDAHFNSAQVAAKALEG